MTLERRLISYANPGPLWQYTSTRNPVWTDSEDGSSVLFLEVPGFKRENLSVSLLEDRVTVTGKRNDREHISFIRALPRYSNPDSLAATLEDGILTLRVQRQTPREVQIEVQ